MTDKKTRIVSNLLSLKLGAVVGAGCYRVIDQMKENGGNMNMANNGSRTMAFQIPEELFQRIKEHLDRESLRLGRKYTQREFVLGLIEEALTAAENTCQPQGYRGHPAAPGGRRGRPAAPGGRRGRLPVR